jgi:hypothetical protein
MSISLTPYTTILAFIVNLKNSCMTTSKVLILSSALVAGVIGFCGNALAQASDNATLNIVLADVRSIKVNPAQATVQLNFATPTDYQNGVTLSEVAHLEVTSTGAYQVTVKSSGPTLDNGTNTIPVNTISMVPSLNAGSTDAGISFQTITLSPTAQQMITTPNGSPRVIFDVRYTASGGQPYIDKPAGTYVTTVTFSIEPS